MPELADVEGYRRRLSEHGRGHRVSDVEVRDRGVLCNATPQGLGKELRGRRLQEPERHGKFLLAHTDGPTLLLHFGMTGELSWSPRPDDRHRHDRVVILLDSGELRYRDQRKLQGIWLAADSDDAHAAMGHPGPDAYGLGRGELEERLSTRRGRLKSALMDQEVIAGLGNLLADEILWQARLHPEQAPANLDSAHWDGLHRAMTRVLRGSVKVGRVPARQSWLTGVRDGPEPACPRCGARVRRMHIGGRTTALCPRCQRSRRESARTKR